MNKITFVNNTSPLLSAENLNTIQDNIEDALNEMLQKIFPIGSTYTTQNSNTNPANILGFGTWERLQATIPLGVDDNDTSYQTIGTTGGSKTVTLTIAQMPSHNHAQSLVGGSGGNPGNRAAFSWSQPTNQYYYSGGDLASTTGGGQPHNNMPPYKIVGYMWLRTA